MERGSTGGFRREGEAEGEMGRREKGSERVQDNVGEKTEKRK